MLYWKCCAVPPLLPVMTLPNTPEIQTDPGLHTEEVARAQQLMAISAEFLATGRLAAIEQAVVPMAEAVEIWRRLQAAGLPGSRRALASACLLKANVLRETHDAVVRPAALEAYAEAVEHFQAAMCADDPEDANHLANLWTNRGMTLLDEGSAGALAEALSCFDRAVELRQRLPLEANPLFVWGLSAAWMNRADVLSRLGQPGQLAEALSSYDKAIQLLHRMPLDEHPTYRARMALAWMNRGLTAQAQGTQASMEEALRCFTQSIHEVPGGGHSAHPEQRRIVCCAHLNRGHAFLNVQPAQPGPAREEAFAALGLAAEFERSEILAAQIGLQARHLLCRAVAYLVDLGEVPADWITETTDAVDDGMALARRWRQSGDDRLQNMETELFRFGALIYRLCQPHFLAEYLLESMDPDRSAGAPVSEEKMHHIAADALWSVTLDIRAQQQADPSAENQSRLLPRLEELQNAEERLTELRLQHLCRVP